jgi:hypothetical protein
MIRLFNQIVQRNSECLVLSGDGDRVQVDFTKCAACFVRLKQSGVRQYKIDLTPA